MEGSVAAEGPPRYWSVVREQLHCASLVFYLLSLLHYFSIELPLSQPTLPYSTVGSEQTLCDAGLPAGINHKAVLDTRVNPQHYLRGV